ncbi:MAG TPA: DUF2914 domain-containing protein [Candidatus Paceibacterota bacterium]|nr:DUF2914 domain-containing protein [Candidatus Paceibacterota bacterium]
MAAFGTFNRVLAWSARNERPLGAVLFAFGFLTDFFTFGVLPIAVVNYFFIGYLSLAAVAAIGAHAFARYHDGEPGVRKALAVLFPLGVQYAFGGLLSGFVVFYTAHSVVLASWPFLIFLALVYIGNEYFRMYKHYLVFQTSLFFFTLYAYAIFGLPLVIGRIGPWTFLGSTVVAILLFAAFLCLLRLGNKARFDASVRQIALACVGIVVLISVSYFTGVIPPVPLVMKDAGVYHSLVKVPTGYRVQAEAPKEWWDIRPTVVHVLPGEALYAYSAVAAPISFSSTVVHRWEQYIDGKGWVTQSRISFPLSGGREGGYRGYSIKDTLTPGKWRISVETAGGQVIGRVRFDIENAGTAPALQEITL